jgi:hypothetical protein
MPSTTMSPWEVCGLNNPVAKMEETAVTVLDPPVPRRRVEPTEASEAAERAPLMYKKWPEVIVKVLPDEVERTTKLLTESLSLWVNMKTGENSPEETLTMSPIETASIRTTEPSCSSTVEEAGKHELPESLLAALVVETVAVVFVASVEVVVAVASVAVVEAFAGVIMAVVAVVVTFAEVEVDAVRAVVAVEFPLLVVVVGAVVAVVALADDVAVVLAAAAVVVWPLMVVPVAVVLAVVVAGPAVAVGPAMVVGATMSEPSDGRTLMWDNKESRYETIESDCA